MCYISVLNFDWPETTWHLQRSLSSRCCLWEWWNCLWNGSPWGVASEFWSLPALPGIHFWLLVVPLYEGFSLIFWRKLQAPGCRELTCILYSTLFIFIWKVTVEINLRTFRNERSSQGSLTTKDGILQYSEHKHDLVIKKAPRHIFDQYIKWDI